MGFKIIDLSLSELLMQTDKKFNASVLMYSNTAAKNLESYMKKNRPWTDRTGEAKRRLNGSAESTKKGARITLAHGVEYGYTLELCHEKRYAIISPTLRIKGPEVMKGFEGMLSKIKV